jgi:type IV secretory pathway VirB10-like protein
MRRTRDPARLADLGDDPVFDLGGAIRALRAQQASAAEVAALGRRLGAQLAAPTTAGVASAGLGLWLKGGAALLLAFAAGFYGVARFESASSGSRHSPATDHLSAQAPSSSIEQPPPQAAAAKPSEPLQTKAAATAHHRRPRIERAVAAPPAAPTPHPDDELVLLKQAESALDRDAASALALAEQHARAYPHGLFAQEREILAIEALLKLRQKPAAVARAEAFVQHYPSSPHARRVRALLERSHLNATEAISPASGHSREGDQH